ncbi:DNA-binding response regulator [Deltaproteobacteria bacterium Smac51]|nr:DNA-binding response regulator [Deltaproteobacteria bacterium Smac51]
MIRAIVADDEPAVASIISHFIEKESLPVSIEGIAENGGQALELIGEMKPDIVFMDIQMPVHTGLEVMRRQPDFRYVIITAFESFNYAQEALRLGACDILLKPIDCSQLLEAISRSIGYNFTQNLLSNQALDFIHNNFATQFDLTTLSEKFHTSASHLARTFKKHVGVSIVYYVNKLRIDKSKTILDDQSISIQEAAISVGYESLNNYYKYFKTFTGMTPAAYRQIRLRKSAA